jgi:hypothetical protein
LQPLHLHDHGGYELQPDNDANPADPVVAESYVQESAENSVPGESFGAVSSMGTGIGEDSPAQTST